MYHAYILENSKGRFYIGHTDDLERRIAQHNDPDASASKYAPKNGPWQLVWSESYVDRGAAMQRERQIKSMKSSKWIRANLLDCKK